MALSDVFPNSLVLDKFSSVRIKEHSLADVDNLAQVEPGTLLQLGLSVWHQIVSRKLLDVDPSAMAEYVVAADPFLYRRIEEFLSISALRDLYHVEMRVQDPQIASAPPCATICLAKTYPNDLVLADIAFANPYKPIPPERRRFSLQNHEGLGLLPELLQRVVARARVDRVDRVLLTAANADLVPLFRKHGFELDGTDYAEACLEEGSGIPMQIILG